MLPHPIAHAIQDRLHEKARTLSKLKEEAKNARDLLVIAESRVAYAEKELNEIEDFLEANK